MAGGTKLVKTKATQAENTGEAVPGVYGTTVWAEQERGLVSASFAGIPIVFFFQAKLACPVDFWY
ncbi:hypothetical protein D4S03_10910 [bacterium]|nr:MAG: hypothetical protein D4S03_10910 [bacterium]